MNPYPFESESDSNLTWLRQTLNNARRFSRGYLNDSIALPFPRILVGSGDKLDRNVMERYNISHVLNCAYDEACPSNIKSTLPPERYAYIDAVDSIDVDLFGTWYPLFKQTLDRFLRDPYCRNVYVHCQAGINRSPALAAAYIVKTFGVDFRVCLSRMISTRPCILTNPSFQEQLVTFVKKSD